MNFQRYSIVNIHTILFIKGPFYMNTYQRISLIMVILVPLLFLTVTLVTGRWGFFFWSLLPSFISGIIAFTSVKKHDSRQKLCKECLYKALFFTNTYQIAFLFKIMLSSIWTHLPVFLPKNS